MGRLCNLSQAFPELKLALAGGYTVTRAEWSVGGVRRKPRRMTVRQGGEAQTEWLELLALAEELLEKNEGVALAPELAFPERTLPGALTVVSDASGVDGVGGYGGKSFRIGGATDWRAVLGESKAERIIRQRGRWDSDIHKIYERALAHEHLSGSAAVGGASGAELEALCAGWAQPATFR